MHSLCEPIDTGNDSSHHGAFAPQSPDVRGIRFELRRPLQRITPDKTFRGCGRPLGGQVLVGIGPGGRAGYSGLKSCGKAWLCPVCAAKVGAHRLSDIETVLKSHETEHAGCSVAMLTLTMRHHKGQKLADLWKALSAAWKAATNGRCWKRDREIYGIVGYVRVVEATHGANGWHLHIHSLLMFDSDVPTSQLEGIGGSMFERWSSKLQALGMAAPLRNSGGLDIRRVGDARTDSKTVLAAYLTKIASGIGLELTNGSGKSARGGGRTLWEIGQDAIGGDSASLGLWREWAEASAGKRAISWSRGLRAAAGLGKELTDEEIVEQTEAQAETVAAIPFDSWMELLKQPHLLGEILNLVDAGGGFLMLRDYLAKRAPGIVVCPAPVTS